MYYTLILCQAQLRIIYMDFLHESLKLYEVSNYPLFIEELEKAMAPHSSTLAWKIPWTEEPGRQQSMGLLRVGHD